ncbi:hypothetical protein GOBAR_AA38573 [Gossypium barbadense]|uniref:Uncharacterized protein n=1 Tax=Gossypium barbadense TaxID=3634 RepID=A0A2P5VTH5_GOSBA|nr:hypothetical protein GOBAR_AA38573 [Gossypium barbadense]
MPLQKLSFKEVYEPCSSNDRGHTHEERRLRIDELDECFSAHTAKHTGVPKAVAKQGKRHDRGYSRVEARHDFPKTRDAINPHGRVTWPWVNLIGEHGRGNRKTQACQRQGSILFLQHGGV